MMDATLKTRKRPFLAHDRSVGNVCACTRCGVLGRADTFVPAPKPGAEPIAQPTRWSLHVIDGEQAYICDACSASTPSDNERRRFFDANDMAYPDPQTGWICVPAA